MSLLLLSIYLTLACYKGTFTKEIALTAHQRMQAAGAQLLNIFAVACELARDWRTDLEGLAAYFSEFIPIYSALISSYTAFKK